MLAQLVGEIVEGTYGSTDQLLTVLAAVLLTVLLLVDVATRRVPNALVLPATAAAVALDLWRGSLDALLGAAAGLALFGLLAWGGRRLYGRTALGMGDVKLAMLVGALLGVVGGLVALAIGMLVAAGVAVVALRWDQSGPEATLPYGAALAAGALVVLVWQVASVGPQLASFVLSLP